MRQHLPMGNRKTSSSAGHKADSLQFLAVEQCTRLQRDAKHRQSLAWCLLLPHPDLHKLATASELIIRVTPWRASRIQLDSDIWSKWLARYAAPYLCRGKGLVMWLKVSEKANKIWIKMLCKWLKMQMSNWGLKEWKRVTPLSCPGPSSTLGARDLEVHFLQDHTQDMLTLQELVYINISPSAKNTCNCLPLGTNTSVLKWLI